MLRNKKGRTAIAMDDLAHLFLVYDARGSDALDVCA